MKELSLEVLISCMNEPDTDLVERSGITTDVLMINQCDKDEVTEETRNNQNIRKMDVNQRGLSRSRNLAIENARGDICLLCDDDEVLADNYESIIVEAFQQLPDAAIIAFNVKNKVTRLKPKVQRIGYLNSLKLASYQLAFHRKRIFNSGVRFDPAMGAGSGNGAGEENKFLLDCIKKYLPVYFVPETIGEVCQVTSTWFFGFDKKFFYQRGIATRYMMGFWMSCLYAVYYLVAKYPRYRKEVSLLSATVAYFSGIIKNDISHQQQEGLH